MTEHFSNVTNQVSIESSSNNNKEEKFVDEIENLVKQISHIQLKSETDIAIIIFSAMKFMRLYKNISGLSKRKIVIESLKKIVELQDDLSPSAQQALILAIDLIAPPIIDTIYNAATQKINFNPSNTLCCVSVKREK